MSIHPYIDMCCSRYWRLLVNISTIFGNRWGVSRMTWGSSEGHHRLLLKGFRLICWTCFWICLVDPRSIQESSGIFFLTFGLNLMRKVFPKLAQPAPNRTEPSAKGSNLCPPCRCPPDPSLYQPLPHGFEGYTTPPNWFWIVAECHGVTFQ